MILIPLNPVNIDSPVCLLIFAEINTDSATQSIDSHVIFWTRATCPINEKLPFPRFRSGTILDDETR